MRLEILHHANCFDGCASAALFSRWFTERESGPVEVVTRPVQHGPGPVFPPDAFQADVNAVVDFRYSPSPRLDWWFDHHASGFPTPADRAAFEADHGGQKFWDPGAPSCTGFIARVLGERYGWLPPELEELIRWADVIDAARFPSAAMAVRLEEPALRIMTLLEVSRDPALQPRMIAALSREPLARIAAEPWVAEPLVPILERHFRSIDTVRKHARMEGGVVHVDLSETGLEAANKFIAYDLFPRARYTVVVSRDPKRTKISVGSNPWSAVPRTHDISKICERYGGGGHPVVGAVSLPPDRVDDARRVALEILRELQDGSEPRP